MILTYNQILKEFSDFASAHKQIQNFGNGDLWEIVEHNQLLDFNYPLFWVVDQPATLGEGTFTWNFNVLAMDLVKKDESNENAHARTHARMHALALVKAGSAGLLC